MNGKARFEFNGGNTISIHTTRIASLISALTSQRKKATRLYDIRRPDLQQDGDSYKVLK